MTRWQPPRGTPPLTARELLSHRAGIGLGDYAARFSPEAPRPGLPDHVAGDFAMSTAGIIDGAEEDLSRAK